MKYLILAFSLLIVGCEEVSDTGKSTGPEKVWSNKIDNWIEVPQNYDQCIMTMEHHNVSKGVCDQFKW